MKILTKLLVLAALMVFAGNSSADELSEMSKVKEKIRAQYGENKQITDGNYDKSLRHKKKVVLQLKSRPPKGLTFSLLHRLHCAGRKEGFYIIQRFMLVNELVERV